MRERAAYDPTTGTVALQFWTERDVAAEAAAEAEWEARTLAAFAAFEIEDQRWRDWIGSLETEVDGKACLL